MNVHPSSCGDTCAEMNVHPSSCGDTCAGVNIHSSRCGDTYAEVNVHLSSCDGDNLVIFCIINCHNSQDYKYNWIKIR